MTSLTPFTDCDFNLYAGVESTNPHIASLSPEGSPTDLIWDGDTVQVIAYDDEGSHTAIWHAVYATPARAHATAAAIATAGEFSPAQHPEFNNIG
jgi:hypothetical protein